MPALDLSSVSVLPFVANAVTPGTSGQCREIILPANVPLKVTLHNREKSSKTLAFSADQTLTDGGVSPATQFFTVTDPLVVLRGRNGLTGLAMAQKLFVFSASHASVNCEIILEEGEL
jgi:hypothetical protein